MKKYEYWVIGIVLAAGIGTIIALAIHVAPRSGSNEPKANSGPPTVSSSPVPLTPEQRKAQEKEKRAQASRNGARETIENLLLKSGYDVQVGFVGAQGSTHMLIMGEPVNRVFIYQLVGPGFRRSLQRDGFTKVTFMRSQTDWVGEYDVATNTIRAIPQ